MYLQSYLRIVIILVILMLAACGKSKTHFHDLSTPSNALKTVFSAIQEDDPERFRKILSAQTLHMLETESQRTGKSSKSILQEYLSRRQDEDISEISETKEERIDDSLMEVHYRSNSSWKKIRFLKENNEWKMDGFGQPMKPA